MPITASPTFTLSIGITVQPINNHGRRGWRIFRPDGDYVCQFTAALAARTALKWAGMQEDGGEVEREIEAAGFVEK
jgi:hypothetical protein